MNISMLGFEKSRVDENSDRYRIDIRFKCDDCGNEYLIGDTNGERMEKFLKSIVKLSPNRYIGCPKCSENLNTTDVKIFLQNKI